MLQLKMLHVQLYYYDEYKLVSFKSYKHTLADITDYSAPTQYDDNELKTLINSSVSDINTTLTQKADLYHTHTMEDILDYEPYDDTEIITLINAKTDSGHRHTLADLTDYTAPISYNDTELRIMINTNTANINNIKNTKADKGDLTIHYYLTGERSQTW